MNRDLLSIVIPTRNRAGYLNHCLALIMPSINEDISIIVQDNASIDETFEVVSQWMTRYPSIKYIRNQEDIGPDRNFELALKNATGEYVWLLGDTYTASKATINLILNSIANSSDKYDAILINAHSRVKGTSAQSYFFHIDVFNDLGWHLTSLSTMIYSRRLILSASFWRFHDTNFLQTGILFEYLAERQNINVCWYPNLSVESILLEQQIKVSWQMEAFNIWLGRWPSFVLSLPTSYPLKSKIIIIRKHNILTNVFGYSLLYSIKFSGILSLSCLFSFGIVGILATPSSILPKLLIVKLVPYRAFLMIKKLRLYTIVSRKALRTD